MNNPELETKIDVLTLFREDLVADDRIRLFQQAAEQLREDIDAITTPENVAKLNASYQIGAVFNSHGNEIDAGQTLRDIQHPFITFIEGTGAPDIHQDSQFGESVRNSFEMRFNGALPMLPSFPLTPETCFGHWEYRGLLAKASIVAPIDVRYYSARMLDALIGDKYSQEYLNRRFNIAAFEQFSAEELTEKALNQGKLVMHSNAVRELTSTRQVIETLLMLQDPTKLEERCGAEIAKKTLAIGSDIQRNGDKLPAYIVYGTDHHAFTHELTRRGIGVTRSFPGSIESIRPFKHAGSAISPFFNGHHFELSDTQLETYARSYVLESLLLIPLLMNESYGLVTADNRSETLRNIWRRVSYIARDPELHGRLPEIVEAFRLDKMLPVQILRERGITLHSIDE